jgi:hypothetical protein
LNDRGNGDNFSAYAESYLFSGVHPAYYPEGIGVLSSEARHSLFNETTASLTNGPNEKMVVNNGFGMTLKEVIAAYA